jgi:hypothetical protein
MFARKIRLIVISAAALSPMICAASPETASFDACLSAFEKSMAAPGAAIPAYKVLYRTNRFESPLEQFFASKYIYDLEARDPNAGASLVRARCSTNGRGTVVSLAPLSLSNHAASLASQ